MTVSFWAKNGFSLLELSVVLVIVATVVGVSLSVGFQQTRIQQVSVSWSELKKIKEVLRFHAQYYGKLPCPSSITLPDSDGNYGMAAEDCSDTSPPAGVTRVEFPPGNGTYVRIGAVPIRALALPDDFISDAWGQRYFYAVSEDHIVSIDEDTDGVILIEDGNGNTITDQAAFIIGTHGATGRGAILHHNQALRKTCNTSTADSENCDITDSGQTADGVFSDAPFNDGDVSTSFFDDYVLWDTSRSALQ